jgi:hypothetical protein
MGWDEMVAWLASACLGNDKTWYRSSGVSAPEAQDIPLQVELQSPAGLECFLTAAAPLMQP